MTIQQLINELIFSMRTLSPDSIVEVWNNAKKKFVPLEQVIQSEPSGTVLLVAKKDWP